jgi:AcrR family transcriptional regulator
MTERLSGTQVVRPYRGVSADDRRQQRQRQLLDACLDVVGSSGVHGVTVEAVCAEARLTKRYFYENYADRDALLAAISDEMMNGIRDTVTAAVATGRTSLERARAAVEALVASLTSDPRLARLYVESTAHPVLLERRDRAIKTFTELIVTEVYGDGRPQASATQRSLGVRLVIAGTTDVVTSWLADSLDVDRETLIATIVAVGMATDSAL